MLIDSLVSYQMLCEVLASNVALELNVIGFIRTS